MHKIDKWEKKVAWIVSIIVGAAILVTACLTLWNKPLFDEYLLLAVLITVFPSAVLDYVDYRWKRSVDEYLPDLFRSLVQAQQTGMPLPQALEEASKRRYGPLTEELKKMVTQMSWGMSFEKALQSFGERVGTALVGSAVPLVVEASRSGGQVEKVFAPTGKFIQSTLTMEKERRTQTRPYVAIIYVAFFVFLFTIILLFDTLFVQAAEVSTLGSTVLTPEEARRFFFHMSMFQAFFGGLVAGKMGEGTVSAGLKHSVILLASGYLALKFLM
ncbi:MAG: type II secretion system F family protein [Candidatus Bathyarchaeota archaeon]|nr:MAG: type II secretion system F family protein [Candidatus Bathyarchaeota archaeon]